MTDKSLGSIHKIKSSRLSANLSLLNSNIKESKPLTIDLLYISMILNRNETAINNIQCTVVVFRDPFFHSNN